MSFEQARLGEAIRSTASAVRAPRRLHDEVAAQRLRLATRRRVAGAVAATAATALAALLALAQAGGGTQSPTIAEAAAVALREPALAAPARDPRAPAFLRASSGGVAFPDYTQSGLGWRADGLLRTRRGGHEIVAVSYTRATAGRVGYAIVGGAPLRATKDAATVVRDGSRYAVSRDGAMQIVSWQRGGRTCVLASRDASAQALLRLASWRPAGGSTGRY
jgi:hypothetical protein